VHGGETDVVRVFDENVKLTEEKMRGYLKEADLEEQGFVKTVEVSTETDENGRITRKRTIYYRKTDDCSRVMFWESVLEQRLPRGLRNSKLASTTVKEVQSRIAGRKTKSCTVGLEIHPDRCINEIPGGNSISKRRVARAVRCSWCLFCWNAAIVYND
jgi:hypothetical protein